MPREQSDEPKYERLLAAKAAALEELQHRKPGQKHYRRSLKAFLDADAKAQKALLKRIAGKAPPPPGEAQSGDADPQ